MIRTAWISDDAAITLRTVLNFVHGYGLTFNLDERVQAYTHPLWLFLIAGVSAAVGNVFVATFLLSIALSVLTLWFVMTRVAVGPWAGLAAAAVLVFSRAFIDYSTSGLENPLSHLLLVIAAMSALSALAGRQRWPPLALMLLAGLIYLTRPDLVLIVAPLGLVVLHSLRSARGTVLLALAAAAAPVVSWTAFSVVYYGVPLPNTAYAKLGTGVALGELLVQGVNYFLDSLGRDPITLCATLTGVVVGMRGPPPLRALSVGILLYLAYVAAIGGDFMSGRFLTAPLVAAAVIVARQTPSPETWRIAAAGIGVTAGLSLPGTLLSGPDYEDRRVSSWGIADERGYYFQRFGLLAAPRGTFDAPDWKLGPRAVVTICGGLGFSSIASGPGTHLIDRCGIADPLLARLPAHRLQQWRIGHFMRQIPTDYEASAFAVANNLKDPATRAYYDVIRRVTRAPLWDAARWRDIVRINLGTVAGPDPDLYRHRRVARSSDVPSYALSALAGRTVGGGPRNAPGNIGFLYSLDVTLPEKTSVWHLDVSLDGNDAYLIECRIDGNFVPVARVNPADREATGMKRYEFQLNSPTPPADRIRITGLDGDLYYAVGHLRINGP